MAKIRCRALICDDLGNVCIVKHKKGSGFWSFPGGKLEEDETLEQGMKRELFEEFGVEPSEMYLKYILEIPRINGLEFFYVAKADPEKILKCEGSCSFEIVEVRYVDLEKFEDTVYPPPVSQEIIKGTHLDKNAVYLGVDNE